MLLKIEREKNTIILTAWINDNVMFGFEFTRHYMGYSMQRAIECFMEEFSNESFIRKNSNY